MKYIQDESTNTLIFYFFFWIAVALMTWGSIAIELFLGLNIFFSSRTVRMVAFATGIVFHLIIALNFGLISFLFAMVASLLLYLIPFGNILSRSKKFSRYEI